MPRPEHPIALLDSDFDAVFDLVCEEGFSALGRTADRRAYEGAGGEWQFEPALAPAYAVGGRMRFLTTLRLARAVAPKSVLEVAAGGAFLSACLCEPGRRVVVNDLRPIESLGNWRGGSEIETIVGDLFSLNPARIGRFDLVIASDVIEHVAHGDRFVRHLASFLGPGGRLLVTTPNGRYFRNKLPTYAQVKDFSALESRQFMPDADGHLYLYTPEELETLLSAEGLTIERLELTTTPFVSGNAGFRLLPKGRALHRLYARCDRALCALGGRLARRLCTQMYCVARRPSA